MKLNPPKISIIVPVYNVEDYVPKCFKSIIDQTYENLEIILVDDGSTDKSGDICDEYAKKDNRMIVIHQENQGLSMARNNALDIASGEYIGFVDGDDWIAPDMYSTLYENATKYEADISMCNFYYVSQSGHLSPYSNENTPEKVLEGIYKISHNIRLSNNCVWNRLYKRRLFDDIRFPERKTFEDIFVMHRLVDNANKIVLSTQCKYYYLLRENGITLSPFNLGHMDNFEAYKERYNYISNKYPSLEKVCKKFIFSSLLWVMGKAYAHNRIENHRDVLLQAIDSVRHHDYLDCGLSIEQMVLLKLLFSDIRKYIIKMNISTRQNNEEIVIIENTIESNEPIANFIGNESFDTDSAISIIIPVYNVGIYLKQCLDSVLSQSLRNIEIICINDGSTDNSLEILKEYEKKDNRIIIISRENKGVAVSRNEGIQIAKGEFVIFMDSDDWYPTKSVLTELYDNAKKNNALICGGSLSIYDNGKTIYGKKETKFKETGFIEYRDYQYSYFFHRFIYNREMLINNNIFFPQYIHYEDPPFLIKAMLTANKFYAIESIVYTHRINHKATNFTDDRIANIFKGLKDCLILSSENCLSRLHTFTANSLINNYFPFSENLLHDTGKLHKLLFELLSFVDYSMIGRNYITRALNFLGQINKKYLDYVGDNTADFFSVFAAYKKILHDRNIYSFLKDDFVSLALKEKSNSLYENEIRFAELYNELMEV
jgi:glycosyltransferase involved in cell wall biosynthesis